MIILDSSFLVAFHNTRDVHHEAASEVMLDLVAGRWGEILLPEYVFLEVATVLMARRGRDIAIQVATTLLESREVELVPCSDLLFDAFETFRTQPGRALSFTDAAIVTLARQRGALSVATFDHDFVGIQGISIVPPP